MNFFFVILFVLCGYAQTAINIDTIIVHSEDTNKDILLRELVFDFKKPVSLEKIRYSINRIKSLNIFNDVTYRIYKNGNKNTYCLEIKTFNKVNFLVLPTAEIYDSDFSKFSYGVNVSHRNAFRRNIKLTMAFSFGFRKVYRFGFFDPWIFPKYRLIFSFGGKYEEHENLDYTGLINRNTLFYIGIGKRYSSYGKIMVETHYNQYGFEGEDYLAVSGGKNDRFLGLSIRVDYDRRDFPRLPEKGIFIGGSISFFEELQTSKIYTIRLDMQLESYYRLSKSFFYANNLQLSSLFGNPTYYQLLSFGKRRLIRGKDSFEQEFGHHYIILRNELRYIFLKEYRLKTDLPILRNFVNNMGTSLFAYLWQDSGIMYQGINDFLFTNNYRTGYGLGVSIVTPYIRRISFEYGFDFHGFQKFVLNVSNSF